MISLFIVWYLIGLLVWCATAVVNGHFYGSLEHPYYTWAAINLPFLVYIILKKPKEVKILRPVFYLMCAEAVGEVFAWVTGIDINNNKVVGIFFIIVVFVCIIIFIKDLKQWRRQNL
jgi:hypothetical protein